MVEKYLDILAQKMIVSVLFICFLGFGVGVDHELHDLVPILAASLAVVGSARTTSLSASARTSAKSLECIWLREWGKGESLKRIAVNQLGVYKGRGRGDEASQAPRPRHCGTENVPEIFAWRRRAGACACWKACTSSTRRRRHEEAGNERPITAKVES